MYNSQIHINYPEVLVEILCFFSEPEVKERRMIHKSVVDFCTHYHGQRRLEGFPQPRIISGFCERLVELGRMSLITRSGIDGAGNQYLCIVRDRDVFQDPKKRETLHHELCCKVFGFPYIYESCKDSVLPLEHTDPIGNKQLGTCFIFLGGIVTAKHCLTNAKSVSMSGVAKNDLENARVIVSKNQLIDLAFIKLCRHRTSRINYYDTANVLDDVITLGFPMVPGYHNFLSVENAVVSARFTITSGSVVSLARDIWIKENLLLITAKIRGGNSGGPVIRKDGALVGISVSSPVSEGDYDDLGYGTALPVSFATDLLNEHNVSELDMRGKFANFPDDEY